MATDTRAADRKAELARQKEVNDALAEHAKASTKEAERRLAISQGGGVPDDPVEEKRLADTRDALDASVKAFDKKFGGAK